MPAARACLIGGTLFWITTLELNLPESRGRVAAALLSLALMTTGLVACGSHTASAGAARAAAKAGTGSTTLTGGSAASASEDEMVSAVPAGRSSSGFRFKFGVRSHPGVGEPVDIDILLTPTSVFDRVQVVFRANDGLEIRSGAQIAPIEKPEIDVPLQHTLTVVPKREGIFSVTAIVLSDSSDGAVSRAYAIPLIAGDGLPEHAADPAAPAAEASATQPTQSAHAATQAALATTPAIQATQTPQPGERRPPGS